MAAGPRSRRAAWPLILFALGSLYSHGICTAPAAAEPRGTDPGSDGCAPEAVLLTQQPQQNDLIEFRIDCLPEPSDGQNPFDPDQFDFAVRYAGPDGRELVTSAFWHETGQWRARLLAETPGSWQIRVGNAPPTHLEVSSSDVPGVIRRDGRRLVYSDGSPYLALGQNVAWARPQSSPAGFIADYGLWYPRLREVGANWTRVWMSSWAYGLEWKDTPLGDYRNRLARAAALDEVLNLGESQGLRAHLVLQNHGPFSEIALFNSEWDANPFNAANGGPLERPGEVWTSPEARQLFRRRFRYIVSRYWAHPGILAWELWNEFDLVEGGLLSPAPVEWHREMAAYLRSLDPLDRPITTSHSLAVFVENEEVWAVPDIDIVSPHFYNGVPEPLPVDPALGMVETIQRLRRFGKPIVIGEADTHTAGPADEEDPTGEHLLYYNWAALFASAGGSAMPWWWDVYVHPRDLYHRHAPTFDFAGANADIISGATPSVATAASGSGPVIVLELRNEAKGAMWVRNARDQWYEPDPTRHDGVSVLLPAGEFTVQFWDMFSGQAMGDPLRVDGAVNAVTVPGFSRGILVTYRGAP